MTEKILNLAEGHPVHTYLEETKLIRQLIEELKEVHAKDDFQKFFNVFNQLCTIEKRFARKENQLFPFLEKNGWDGPSKNMWSFHDTLRDIIRIVRKNISDGDRISTNLNASHLCHSIINLLYVEENVLFPASLELLSEKEWKTMSEGEVEIGWMLEKEPLPYSINTEEITAKETILNADSNTSKQHYDEGYMTIQQVNLLFKTMPLDITYVDENDRVIFYNRGEERVFPRSSGIIGREVKFCHPPKSVDTVLKILEAFRSGERSESSFWINHKERLIYIRYFAVRDAQKNYKGVIEISQDITEIKTIEGERRLLEWS